GVRVHQLGEELLVEAPPIDADAYRTVVRERDLDDGAEVLVTALRPNVAGVDAVLGERPGARRVLGEQQVAVVMEIADDRHIDLSHDVGDGLGARLVGMMITPLAPRTP